jgi:hypothetical protein
MHYFWKTLSGPTTDPLSWTVWRYEFRMSLLKTVKRLKQSIVFTIGNFRGVLDVVEFLVTLNLGPKLLDFFGG